MLIAMMTMRLLAYHYDNTIFAQRLAVLTRHREEIQMKSLRKGLVLFAFAIAASSAQAQQYPTKPVRLVVPFAPGGGVDATTRVLSRKLSEAWGQQMVIDNRAGAGANIGAEIVARAVPDGYTLMLTNNALAISAGLYPKLAYNALTDFTPVSQVLASPFVLVVPTSS